MRWPALASFAAAALALAIPAGAQIAPDSIDANPAQAAQSLRDLVGRYLDWRGPAFAQLETIHERLQIDTAIGRQAGGLWMGRDGRTRRETSSAAGTEIAVAAPGGSWRIGPSASPDDPKAFERARRYALLEFGDALTGRGGATVELAGSAEVEDHTWSVVRVGFGDADRYEALLDPVTGALCCYRITEGGVARTELFGEWRLVDGVRMPFAELTKTDSETGARVSAIELNKALDPGLFQRPDAGG